MDDFYLYIKYNKMVECYKKRMETKDGSVKYYYMKKAGDKMVRISAVEYAAIKKRQAAKRGGTGNEGVSYTDFNKLYADLSADPSLGTGTQAGCNGIINADGILMTISNAAFSTNMGKLGILFTGRGNDNRITFKIEVTGDKFTAMKTNVNGSTEVASGDISKLGLENFTIYSAQNISGGPTVIGNMF